MARDLDHLTVDGAKRLGEQLKEVLILRLNPRDSGPGQERVEKVAVSLLKKLKLPIDAYQFVVLDSDLPNAFSHPGGCIYVSRRLLEMIPEDEPAPLEFVLAHEIAHLQKDHALECLKDRGVRSYPDGTLQKLYLLILPHGYPDKFEYQADRMAFNMRKQAGRSDHDCLKFLRMLANYAKRMRLSNERGKVEDLLKKSAKDPPGQRAYSPIENHLLSHPPAFRRLIRLEELRTPLP